MGLLLAVAFALGTVACATTQVTMTSIGPDGLGGLVGRWEGVLTAPDGATSNVGMQIAADGTYVADMNAFSSRGLAEIKEGGLVLTPQYTSGGEGLRRAWTAALFEGRDGTRVLRGRGTSEKGPLSFEMSQPPMKP